MVKLYRRHNHGDEIVVGIRTVGDLFGYRAVLAEKPYGISAEAIEPSVVCTIPRENFLAAIEESHDLAVHLLKRIAREFRLAEEQLAERSGEPVAKRTARLLLRLAGGRDAGARTADCPPIPSRREDLALMLGTTPETLSRTLHAFAKRGLVEADRKGLQIRDLAGLERLAE